MFEGRSFFHRVRGIYKGASTFSSLDVVNLQSNYQYRTHGEDLCDGMDSVIPSKPWCRATHERFCDLKSHFLNRRVGVE